MRSIHWYIGTRAVSWLLKKITSGWRQYFLPPYNERGASQVNILKSWLYSVSCICFVLDLTLSTALNLVHRNSFPNLSDFYNILLNFIMEIKISGGATFEKHADLEKKNQNSRNHVQTFGTC